MLEPGADVAPYLDTTQLQRQRRRRGTRDRLSYWGSKCSYPRENKEQGENSSLPCTGKIKSIAQEEQRNFCC
ncbi:hypothetical protein E2C01_056206 [Portunus trituberculatus]|uniref:Uncharacterized protein n=1 Tax=Portunus trituberculatus TaxID=210409 RepID=A0A5B7GWQ9_PORTR|nr:hypothetical protein [Portunus trituberculatus]